MKKTMDCLNGIKSRCFMLVACFVLLMGVSSCNSDNLEVNSPDEQKGLSKAELIELALSRMPPQTRANAPFPVVMVTTNKTVAIKCDATEDMVIHWGGGATTPIINNSFYTHTYSDNEPSHVIFLEGSSEAITSLDLYQDGLIYLDVTNNTKLETLLCNLNNLDALDLTNCPNLTTVWASGNNISSIDVTHSPKLEILLLHQNQLTDIDVSKNLNLHTLWVRYNKITALDLTKNTNLKSITLGDLPINTINNLPISSRSFAVFSKLELLDVSHTPFTSLDLSSNPLVVYIDISGTVITQLDISNLKIESLCANNSNLTKLIYSSNNLLNTVELRIGNTPFEKLSSNLYPLITTALPNRNLPNKYGYVQQGYLYTNSSALITPFLSYLTAKNWVVNQQYSKKQEENSRLESGVANFRYADKNNKYHCF